MSGWIGVDLDGTLAKTGGLEEIGEPIPLMVDRVKAWLKNGREVRILTARVGGLQTEQEVEYWREAIKTWCLRHLGQALEVTAQKDYEMIELWDDRAIPVEKNTGKCLLINTGEKA